MSDTNLVGTVHKPVMPEVPEPEGWTLYTKQGTDQPWYSPLQELHGLPSVQRLSDQFISQGYLTRLVRIGTAPKPPKAADIELMCAHALADAREIEQWRRNPYPWFRRFSNH